MQQALRHGLFQSAAHFLAAAAAGLYGMHSSEARLILPRRRRFESNVGKSDTIGRKTHTPECREQERGGNYIKNDMHTRHNAPRAQLNAPPTFSETFFHIQELNGFFFLQRGKGFVYSSRAAYTKEARATTRVT